MMSHYEKSLMTYFENKSQPKILQELMIFLALAKNFTTQLTHFSVSNENWIQITHISMSIQLVS